MTEIIVNPGLVTTKIKILSETAFDVERVQDVQPIIEANKRDQADKAFLNGYSESGDLKHVARIPLIILEQWAKEAGINRKAIFGPEMSEIIRKKLNDPDNKFLRTGMGEI